MAGVRVVVTLNFPNAEIADQAAAGMIEMNKPVKSREGMIQYEVFRSAEDPTKVMLMEHWESREIYDKHWNMQLAGGPPDLDANLRPAIEFYSYQEFGIDGSGVWSPIEKERQSKMINWP